MENFFKFEWAQKKNEILIEATCEYVAEDLHSGHFSINEPLKMKISEGNKLYDIVHFQDPFNFAISQRVHKILMQENITGWKSFQLDILGVKDHYYGISIIGRCGKLERPKSKGFITGYTFDYDTWDGSDFFFPEDTLLLFCTEKVRNLLILNNVSNIELTDIRYSEWYNNY